MRKYELGFILKPVLSNEEKAEMVEKVKAFITKFDAQVTNVEDWGKKQLAYEIAKYTEGYYAFIKFSSTTDAIAKIENECRLLDAIIRHIIVAEEEESTKPTKKKMARKPKQDKKNFTKKDKTDKKDKAEKEVKEEVEEVAKPEEKTEDNE